MRIFRPRLTVTHKQAPFVAGLAIAVIGLLAGAGLTAHRVSAADPGNDIISGGFSSPSDFISRVRSNNSGSGHHDLQAVYAYKDFGLTSSQYSDFASNAKSGTTCTNGNLYNASGDVVGTDASSIGRNAAEQGSGYYTLTIAGNKYYGNVNAKAFASKCLDVSILYDSNGQASFAVLKACGNPVKFTPKPVKPAPAPPKPAPAPAPAPKPAPTPSYSCVQLVGAIVDQSTNSYKFTVTGAYANGATPVSADFTFGDGTSQNGVKLSATTASATHGYPNVNKAYTATATLHFVAAGKAVSTTSAKCQTPVTVTEPYCQALTGVILNASQYEAQFTATAVLNGRTLSSADFDFGDGTSQNGVKPSGSATVVVTHDYAGSGTYNAVATLHFTSGSGVYTAPTCRAVVQPTTVVSECKPGVPVGSAACTPCQYDTNLPSDSIECVQPQTSLPNTGAGDTIAIFAVVMVGGFLGYRQLLYRRHKAAFAAAERGTAALPLGQPLDSSAPLAGTPLAGGKRRSFRRRQF